MEKSTNIKRKTDFLLSSDTLSSQPTRNKVELKYYTLANSIEYGRMILVPYRKFKNIELIGEGGFSKIYKATWIDCQVSDDRSTLE
ncbi:unnamed protein product [Rhizophagus irregularis]|nr:unnamed protein product [Rhizophagus irregularis]